MENFFNDIFEYNLFKKALKATEGETVVVNKLATDDILKHKDDSPRKNAPVQHKNMSEKFEPSPFGRYFGSKRKRTTPLDMSDFSSWKNKNYRNIEEKSAEENNSRPTFSLSEYMKSKSMQKFNDADKQRTENKKPITQLSTEDPDLRKYSLDSYMHKLEEEVIADDKFKENDDLLEPILNFDEFQADSVNQDEDFSNGGNNIEKFAFNDESVGDNYSLDKNELDEVRRRLEILENQTNLFKEEQSEVKAEQPEPDISKFFEAEDNSQTAKVEEENIVKEEKEPIAQIVKEEKPASPIKRNRVVRINRSNILTKDDFKTMTDNFMSQFSNNEVSVSDLKSQSELESRLARLAFENKKNNLKAEKKVLSDEGFKKELKSNYNISNLEMDNKLLRISNRLKKEEPKKKEVPEIKVQPQPEPKPETKPEALAVLPEIKKTTPKLTNKKKRGKSRRRIDGDIIGEIDFD